LTESIKISSSFIRIILSISPKKGELMRTIQRVLNLLKNINPLLRRYVICLILSRGRKNCASMAHLVGVPKKKLYSFLSVAEMASKEISQHLLEYIYDTRTDNTLRALAIDPTHIIKLYAQKIQKLCCDRAGCTKHIERCMVPVCAMITDKYRTIPIDFKFWLQEKVIGEKLYKSKAMIAQELINEAKNKGIHFDFVVFDGAFAVPAMFDYFEETKDLFIMRIPRNRKITTADGVCAQLKNHPALKLTRVR
jgi:SRSO17 transposase